MYSMNSGDTHTQFQVPSSLGLMGMSSSATGGWVEFPETCSQAAHTRFSHLPTSKKHFAESMRPQASAYVSACISESILIVKGKVTSTEAHTHTHTHELIQPAGMASLTPPDEHRLLYRTHNTHFIHVHSRASLYHHYLPPYIILHVTRDAD
jgi:hypothetical protein